MIPQKPYLKSSEVAEIFDVNSSTVSLWVKKGRIKPHKTLGGNFRFLRTDVERLLSRQKQFDKREIGPERRIETRFVFTCPVLVKIGDKALSFTYNAFVRDLSGHGLNLIVFDNNGLLGKLASGEVSQLAVLNLPDTLFKDVVVGHIMHFEQLDERQVVLGVSLD
jgi:excisionase family DNA binding protein